LTACHKCQQLFYPPCLRFRNQNVLYLMSCVPAPCLQAYTQRLTVDHKVALMCQVARGALAGAAAEADLAGFKVCACACNSTPVARCTFSLHLSSDNGRPAKSHPSPAISPSSPPRLLSAPPPAQVDVPETPHTKAVLRLIPATPGGHPGAKVRLAGDRYIFLEYGPMELDIALRVRCDVHAVHVVPCCAVLRRLQRWDGWRRVDRVVMF
jgi:hypothetical protein